MTTFERDPTTPRSSRAVADEPEVPLQLVTERMLLGALREQDAAAAAELARRRAKFLSDASLRLGASLDQELTYAAIAGLGLPGLDAWCVVDVVEVGGGLRRIAIIHPDESKRAAARSLASSWTPTASDRIGVPMVARERASVILTGADAAISATEHDPYNMRIIRWLGAGSLLIVPVIAHYVVFGAITYVSRSGAAHFTPEDVALAEALAARCAQALEAARLYAAARASGVEAEEARADAELARADAEVARVEAEAANVAKAQFLRTMSHEFRTPLNAIGGYAQLLEMGVRGPVTPEQLTDLASIRRSQAHLLGLVDAMLSYAQIEAGRVMYATADMPLPEVVDSVALFVDPQMRAKELVYTFEGRGQPLTARADAAKVRQIVMNLLGNAVKFTPAGGRVSVVCAESGPRTLTVRVTDNGIGIPASKLETVFDPFVQINRNTLSVDVGVGLGLAISRELARGMGGDLTAESTLGVGSTFTLSLPAAESHEGGEPP